MKIMSSKKELEELLQEVVEESDSALDKLVRNLIEIAVSQKHKSGGSNQTRRDLMEKTMNQHLTDINKKA